MAKISSSFKADGPFPLQKKALLFWHHTPPCLPMCVLSQVLQQLPWPWAQQPTDMPDWTCTCRGIAMVQKNTVITHSHFCFCWPSSPLCITHHNSAGGSWLSLWQFLCIHVLSMHFNTLPPAPFCLFRVWETAVDFFFLSSSVCLKGEL